LEDYFFFGFVFILVIVLIGVIKNNMETKKERVIRQNLELGTFICIEENLEDE